MAMTVGDIAAALVGRLGRLVAYVGKDGSTKTSANADLAEPIAAALRDCGFATSSVAAATDADAAAVPSARWNQVVDSATLRALHAVRLNLTDVDETAGTQSQKLGDLARQCDAAIAFWEKWCEKRYGLAPAYMAVGGLPGPNTTRAVPSPFSPPPLLIPDPCWPSP